MTPERRGQQCCLGRSFPRWKKILERGKRELTPLFTRGNRMFEKQVIRDKILKVGTHWIPEGKFWLTGWAMVILHETQWPASLGFPGDDENRLLPGVQQPRARAG